MLSRESYNDMASPRGVTYLASRDVTISGSCELQKVGEGVEGDTPRPRRFDKMRLRIEVVVEGNLNEIARNMCPTADEDLARR